MKEQAAYNAQDVINIYRSRIQQYVKNGLNEKVDFNTIENNQESRDVVLAAVNEIRSEIVKSGILGALLPGFNIKVYMATLADGKTGVFVSYDWPELNIFGK